MLQARRENGAAEPTRVLRPSRSQQEELSRDHIRASFADIQDSSPSTSTASRSGHDSTHNNTSIDAKQPQRRNHQRQHAAFPDLMISQPYSIVMFAWGCLLVYSGVSPSRQLLNSCCANSSVCCQPSAMAFKCKFLRRKGFRPLRPQASPCIGDSEACDKPL